MSDSAKRQVFRDVTSITIATYISNAVEVLIAIVTRRFLGPYLTGIWSLFKVALEYCGYTLLGVSRAAMYKIPFLVGKKDPKAVDEIKNTTFTFMFLTSLAISLPVLVSVFLLRNSVPREFIIGLVALSVYVIFQRVEMFYMLLLKVFKNFSLLSRSMFVVVAANIFLVFTAVRMFKLNGLYAATITLSLVNIIYIYSNTKYKARFLFSLNRTKELVKLGLPLMGIGIVDTILWSTDRIMIAKMIGVTFAGYYSLGIMARTSMDEISAIASVVKPRMLEAYGSRENVQDAKKYIVVPTEVNSCILPVALGMAYFAIPVFVRFVLPKFTPGIIAMQIILLDVFFRALCPQTRAFLVAVNKTRWIIKVVLITIALNIILNYILIRKGHGIEGVAVATAISSFFLFIASLAHTLIHFETPKNAVLFILRMMIPAAYIAACVAGLQATLRIAAAETNLGNIIGCASITFLSIPVLVYINKKRKLIPLLLSSMKQEASERTKA
ncbi:MAG: oligosaccharide flippase family protein [Candidatus Omnitrophota bacterium]